MQIESAETDPSASVGDCNYTAVEYTKWKLIDEYLVRTYTR